MSSPTRQSALDALERQLLEAARLERPDEHARHRALLALAGGAVLGSATVTSATAATIGTGGSAAAPAATAATAGAGSAAALGGAKALAGATTLVGMAKAVAIGAISGAVVLGAAQTIQPPDTARAVPTASPAAGHENRAPESVERRSLPARPSDPLRVEERQVDEHPSDLPSNETPLSPPLATPPRAEKRAAPKAIAAPPPDRIQPAEPAPATGNTSPEITSLAEEVALLDRARDALVKGDPGRALVILESYERAKVGTTLSAEAALLRIEALLQRGESTRAAALASEFLRAHPRSPVADRMRSIIQAAPR